MFKKEQGLPIRDCRRYIFRVSIYFKKCQIESFVRFRCPEEYFALMMSKKFGSESDSQEEKYAKAQEDSDEEEEPAAKKGKENKGRSAKRHEVGSVDISFINMLYLGGRNAYYSGQF